MSGYDGGWARSNDPASQGNDPAGQGNDPAGQGNDPASQGMSPGGQPATMLSQPVAPRTRGNRIFSCILALIVGAVFGAVGTVQHQATLALGPVTLPLGLVLSLVGVLALLLGFRLLLTDRLVVLLAAIGIVAVVALFSLPSPGGSVLIPQGLAGLIWTTGTVLIATIVVAWPRLPERAPTPTAAAGEA